MARYKELMIQLKVGDQYNIDFPPIIGEQKNSIADQLFKEKFPKEEKSEKKNFNYSKAKKILFGVLVSSTIVAAVALTGGLAIVGGGAMLVGAAALIGFVDVTSNQAVNEYSKSLVSNTLNTTPEQNLSIDHRSSSLNVEQQTPQPEQKAGVTTNSNLRLARDGERGNSTPSPIVNSFRGRTPSTSHNATLPDGPTSSLIRTRSEGSDLGR